MAFDDVVEAMVANYLEQTGRLAVLDAFLNSVPVDSRVPAIRLNANLPTIQSLLARITSGSQTHSTIPAELGLLPQSAAADASRAPETLKLVVWAHADAEPDLISVDCPTLPTVKLSTFELFMDFYGLNNLDSTSRLRYWHRYSYEDQRWIVTPLTQAFTVLARTCRLLIKQADIDRSRAYGLDLELSVPDVPGVKRARPPGLGQEENGGGGAGTGSLAKRYAGVGSFGMASSIGAYPGGSGGGVVSSASTTASTTGQQMGPQALVSSYLGSTQTSSPFSNNPTPLMSATPTHHSTHTSPISGGGGSSSNEPLVCGQGKGHGRWPQRHTFASVLPILRSIVEDEQSQPRNSKIRQSRLEAANVDALKNKSNAAQAILLLRSFGVARAEEWGGQGENGRKPWSDFRKFAVEHGGREKEGGLPDSPIPVGNHAIL